MTRELPAALKLEVKTSRAGKLTLDARDLAGITPDGYLAALLTERLAHGPCWVVVPRRGLHPGTYLDLELHGLREPGQLEALLNQGWSDWILDEEAWRCVLAEGVTQPAARIAWCRKEHPPRRNRSAGALRESKLFRKLEEFRAAVDAAAEAQSGSGARAEGQLHQVLLEDVLTDLGYKILPNRVGVPDICAALKKGSAAGRLRAQLEAWQPGSDALGRVRAALLDLDARELEELGRVF
ncbi:MAG: hypothetical protein ACYTEZ_07585 [Planctomycetota bacterium]|jgi:hypothetical protein